MIAAHARGRATRASSINYRIFQAFVSISSAVLMIRLVGLLNSIVVTSRFGAGAAMDAYFVASGLPIIAASLVTGALEASVIPAFTRSRAERTPEQTSAFFSTLLNGLVLGTLLLTGLMLIFRQQIVFLVAPALDPTRMGLAIALAPFIFPAFMFLTGIGFLEDILNAEGQFGWPAYAGALVPLTTVVFVLAVNSSRGVVVLCVGTLCGLLLQLGVDIIRLRRSRLTYRPVIDLRNPDVLLALATAWPALCGALISRASPIIDQVFASFLTAGSISALNYSLKLIGVPTGLIFAAIGRAVLPYLSRQVTAHDMRAFKATLRLYLWLTGVVTAVIALLMFALAHPVVRLLFQREAFTAADTTLTVYTLRGFVIGLAPMAVGFVTARAFSALRKTRVLMYTSLFSVCANAIFDFVFARLWQSFGIALATSAVYCCTMIVLLALLSREVGDLDLFTPPPELAMAWRTLGRHPRYLALVDACSRGIHVARQKSQVFYLTIRVWSAAQYGSARSWVVSSLASLRVAYDASREVGARETIQMVIKRIDNLQRPGDARFSTRSALEWLNRPIVWCIYLFIALALGVGSVYMGPSLAFRIALGVPLILVFLRYPYLLLLTWIGVEVLSGSTLSIISSSNLQTALTVPALLLMAVAPLRATWRRMPALIVMLLFLLWTLAGIGLSGLDAVSFMKSWTLNLDFVAIAVLVINVPRTRQQLMGLIDAILIVSALVALYGIYGYVTHSHGQYDTSIGVFRASSIFQLATGLSFHVSLVIPLALYRAYTLRGMWRLAVSILVVILLLTVGITFTRTALIAVPLSILALTLFMPSRRLKLAVFGGTAAFGVIVVAASLLFNVNIFSRFYGQDVTTLNGRIYLWQAILDHFDPGHMLGYGLGASNDLLANLHIGESGITSSSLIGTSPHSLFLGVMYDQGIVGLALILLTFITLLVSLMKRARSTSGEESALFATALAVCVATLAQSVDSNQILIPSLGIYFWIIMALPYATCWRTAPPTLKPGQQMKSASEELSERRSLRAISRPLVGSGRGSR